MNQQRFCGDCEDLVDSSTVMIVRMNENDYSLFRERFIRGEAFGKIAMTYT
jgi:hypothetical protein